MTARPSRSHRTRPGPAVTSFDLAVAIGCPPAAVFALLADIQDFEPIPRSAMVRMVKEPTGPTAPGTRWHEQVRIAPGCWLHIENVVSETNAPSRLGIDFRSRLLTGHLTYVIEAAGEGSVLHHRETLHTHVLIRWLRPLIERRLRARSAERLTDIKTILETPSGPAGSP